METECGLGIRGLLAGGFWTARLGTSAVRTGRLGSRCMGSGRFGSRAVRPLGSVLAGTSARCRGRAGHGWRRARWAPRGDVRRLGGRGWLGSADVREHRCGRAPVSKALAPDEVGGLQMRKLDELAELGV